MTDLHSTGLQSLLEQMEACGASDLHLKAGCPPGLRTDGRLAPIDGVGPLSQQLLDALVGAITTPEQRGELLLTGNLEFAFTAEGLARYRVSLVRQRGQTGAVLRRIPLELPNLDQLGLPAAMKKLGQLPRGLVLVTGATGSGRTTTLAALVDLLNREGSGHVVTIEEPIEFVHRDQACFVTQREIGVDCDSFELALRSALRHDPDVIVIDELRDRERISLALAAAENGLLVLATARAASAVQTFDRMLDAFPSDRHAEVRGRIAASLQAIVAQTLVPKTGGGRVAAVELLIATDAIRSCIRDGKNGQVHIQIQGGSPLGMQTQAAALADLVFNSIVSEETALRFASNPEELKNLLTRGGSPLRAAPKPAAAPAAPPPRARQPAPALPPWAVAPAPPPGSIGLGNSPVAPRRPPLAGPVDPLPARPAAPPRPAAPRNPLTPDLLEKLRKS
jgi:twitching motility protein PilT